MVGKTNSINLKMDVQPLEKAASKIDATSPERFQQQWEWLLDAVPALVFFKDRENRLVQVNRAYAEAVGLPKSQIVGKTLSELMIEPENASVYWEDDRQVIASGRPKRNIIAPHIVDSERWMRTEKIPYRNPDGEIVGVVGLSVDITDLKRTAVELACRVRQQEAMAGFGQLALSGTGNDRLFDEAAALVSQTLEVEYCQIFEHRKSERSFVVRAGVGWEDASRVAEDSLAGYTLWHQGTLVIEDLAAESRFRDLFPLLQHLGVVSSASVVIGQKDRFFGVLGAHATRRRYFSSTDIDFLKGAASLLALAVEQEQADNTIRKSARQLRHLSSKLIQAQEEERHRIFRALHDELGQSLALLKHQVRGVQSKLDIEQGVLQADCGQILDQISSTIENVRRLCHDLTPTALEDLGLYTALRWLCEDFSRHFDFRLAVDLDNVDNRFRHDEQILVYRIFQEALTNVSKHADASRVRVTLKQEDEAVVLEIADNGKGLKGSDASRRKGLGIAAMGERARMLGGRFEIDTRPGRGTCIRVTVSPERIND